MASWTSWAGNAESLSRELLSSALQRSAQHFLCEESGKNFTVCTHSNRMRWHCHWLNWRGAWERGKMSLRKANSSRHVSHRQSLTCTWRKSFFFVCQLTIKCYESKSCWFSIKNLPSGSFKFCVFCLNKWRKLFTAQNNGAMELRSFPRILNDT